MNELRKEGIKLRLQKMFKPDGYFDICELKELLNLAQVPNSHDSLADLRAFHCIYWAAMSSSARNAVAERVVQLFNQPSFEVKFISEEKPIVLEAVIEPKGVLKRLLG